MGEGVEGVGIRALRVRSSRLAEVRREVIFCGERGEGVSSWERIFERFEVDMVVCGWKNVGRLRTVFDSVERKMPKQCQDSALRQVMPTLGTISCTFSSGFPQAFLTTLYARII